MCPRVPLRPVPGYEDGGTWHSPETQLPARSVSDSLSGNAVSQSGIILTGSHAAYCHG